MIWLKEICKTCMHHNDLILKSNGAIKKVYCSGGELIEQSCNGIHGGTLMCDKYKEYDINSKYMSGSILFVEENDEKSC